MFQINVLCFKYMCYVSDIPVVFCTYGSPYFCHDRKAGLTVGRHLEILIEEYVASQNVLEKVLVTSLSIEWCNIRGTFYPQFFLRNDFH